MLLLVDVAIFQMAKKNKIDCKYYLLETELHKTDSNSNDNIMAITDEYAVS